MFTAANREVEIMEIEGKTVLVLGGAGLVAGVAIALKALKPDVMIIGVEPEGAASFSAALRAGRPVRIEVRPTLADGLSIPGVGRHSFDLARALVDKTLQVSEHDIGEVSGGRGGRRASRGVPCRSCAGVEGKERGAAALRRQHRHPHPGSRSGTGIGI